MRKNQILLLAFLFSIISINVLAQNESDVQLFGTFEPQGSARSIGLGGASGSLGGDFTGAVTNPATLGVYRETQGGITLGLNFYNSKQLNGISPMTDQNFRMSFNQAFLVFSNARGKDRKTTSSTTWGLGFNRIADFNRQYKYGMRNYTNSMLDAFASQANNNITQGNAEDAYQLGLLDKDSNGRYYRQTEISSGILQSKIVEESGSLTEFNFLVGRNVQNKFMYGLEVGFPFGFHQKNSTYMEDDDQLSVKNFAFFDYVDNYRTSIFGVNFKGGLLFQPMQNIRLGGFIQSPTFFGLTDTYNSHIASNVEGYANINGNQQSPEYTGNFSYSSNSPVRLGLSGTVLFSNKGLITFDYIFQNDATGKLILDQGSYNYENVINNNINSYYKGMNAFKMGLEYRWDKTYFRGGGNINTNPYKSNQTYKNLGFALGVGTRNSQISFDITYAFQHYEFIEKPYNMPAGTSPAPLATIQQNVSRIILSLGIR